MEDGKIGIFLRVSRELHKEAKIACINEGYTFQDWITSLIEARLKARHTKTWLCQDCGRWTLQGTQMAKIGKCQKCGLDEKATFPC